jgi:hypothetical protein
MQERRLPHSAGPLGPPASNPLGIAHERPPSRKEEQPADQIEHRANYDANTLEWILHETRETNRWLRIVAAIGIVQAIGVVAILVLWLVVAVVSSAIL